MVPNSSDVSPGVVAVRRAEHHVIVRNLFREYAASLGIDLAFQNFDQELAELPGRYAPPQGELLMAELQGIWVGCIGMRELSRTIAEMKRLFVRPAARGRGVARRLTKEIMGIARSRGYRTMRLDTLASMDSAASLYRSLGFAEIEPYYHNPIPGTQFFEAKL